VRQTFVRRCHGVTWVAVITRRARPTGRLVNYIKFR
jgi:hypothetical protein